jgi:hypothetical protein
VSLIGSSKQFKFMFYLLERKKVTAFSILAV